MDIICLLISGHHETERNKPKTKRINLVLNTNKKLSPCGVCWCGAALTTRHLAVTRLTVCTYMCVYLEVLRRRLAEKHF